MYPGKKYILTYTNFVFAIFFFLFLRKNNFNAWILRRIWQPDQWRLLGRLFPGPTKGSYPPVTRLWMPQLTSWRTGTDVPMYTVTTCDFHLPTIVSRGNAAAEHKQAKRAMTHTYREKFVEMMTPQNKLILKALYQQQAVMEVQEQTAREVEQVQAAREAEEQADREVEHWTATRRTTIPTPWRSWRRTSPT